MTLRLGAGSHVYLYGTMAQESLAGIGAFNIWMK